MYRKSAWTILLIAFSLVFHWPALSKNAAVVAAMTPLQLVQSGRYVQALPAFKQMALQNPGDASINYYLGMCAQSAREYDLAEAAFCRVVAGTPVNSPFVPLAQRQLAVLPHRYAPQCALTNGVLCRWQRGKQIRIFLSDGRMMPGTGSGILSSDKYAQVVAQARSNISGMPIAPSYKQGDANLVMEAIKGWDWAVREKLFSYTFVRDPKAADIIVLFTEGPTGCTLYPFGPGQPVLTWAYLAARDNEDEKYRSNAVRVVMAHEFGHCLGLWHATGHDDLMLPIVNFTADESRQAPDALASANDKASLRALYSLPAGQTF